MNVWWFLSGSPKIASSRLQGYRVHDYLLSNGVRSKLLLAPPCVISDIPWTPDEYPVLLDLLAGGVMVVQKLKGPRIDTLVQNAVDRAFVVYVHCDFDASNELPLRCHRVICPSAHLADSYRKRGHTDVRVIEDPIEQWLECKRGEASAPCSGDALRLCWIGSRDKWQTLDSLREVMLESEFSGIRLLTVSDHPEADLPWSLRNVRIAVVRSNVGIVPTGADRAANYKSSNRVLLFMGMGLPVIAGQIPSYEAAIAHGQTGLLFSTKESLRTALRYYQSYGNRRRVALQAYDWARHRYSMDSIGAKWLDALSPRHQSNAGAHLSPKHNDHRKSPHALLANGIVRQLGRGFRQRQGLVEAIQACRYIARDHGQFAIYWHTAAAAVSYASRKLLSSLFTRYGRKQSS